MRDRARRPPGEGLSLRAPAECGLDPFARASRGWLRGPRALIGRLCPMALVMSAINRVA